MGNPQGLIQMGFELFRAGTVFLQRVCTSVTQINSSNTHKPQESESSEILRTLSVSSKPAKPSDSAPVPLGQPS